MKRAIATLMLLAFVAAALTGCSTTQLPAGATAAEKRAALCSDAQMGYTLSTSMIESATTVEANKYWQLYKVGAAMALQTYCAN
jgi:hypothetical protein